MTRNQEFTNQLHRHGIAAEPAPDVNGRPAWYANFNHYGTPNTLTDPKGRRLSYASQGDAIKAAVATLAANQFDFR